MSQIQERLASALAGRYTIDRELGRGGMAVVYLARDERHQRLVALKVMLPEILGDVGAERFRREIQIAARLTHPNIVTVFDSGEVDDLFFYVMPFVEGESLEDAIVRAKQFSIGEAVSITRQVADALDYAHAQGVVHRDIKPANILLARARPRSDGTVPGRNPVVTDFGIARAMSVDGTTRLTSTGIMVGTPTYMSPEQFSGELVDGRSDQYSLACVLYEMLIGEPPFTGTNPMVFLARHTLETVPSLRMVRSTIPDALEQAIFRALSKIPADRFETIADFAHAITTATEAPIVYGTSEHTASHAAGANARARSAQMQRADTLVIHGGGPPSDASRGDEATPPPSVATRLRTLFPRRALIIVGCLVAAAAAALAGWRVLRPAAPERLRLVVLPFTNSGPVGDSTFADGLTEEVIARLSGVPRLGVVARTSAMNYKGTRKSVKEIGKELNVSKLVEGTINWRSASTGAREATVRVSIVNADDELETPVSDFDAGKLDDLYGIASAVAARLDLTTGLAAKERSRLADKPTENREAYDEYLKGNYFYNRSWNPADVNAARVSYENAVRLDPGFKLALAALGRTNAWMFQLGMDKSPARLVFAKQFIDSALRLDPDLAEGHLARGLYKYWGNRDYDGALREFDVVQRALPSSAEAFNSVGNIDRRKGALRQAAASYKLAAELDPRAYQILFNWAEIELYLRDFDQADKLIDRVIEIAPDFIDAAITKAALAIHRQGDPAAARKILADLAGRVPPARWRVIGHQWRAGLFRIVDDSLASAERRIVINTSGLDSAQYLVARAEAYTEFGEAARARVYFDSAAAYMDATVARHPEWGNAHGLLALALAGQGRAAEAVREALQSESMLNETMDALDGPEWVVNVARVYAMVGDKDKAIEWLTWAMKIPSRLSPKWIQLDPAWVPLRGDPRFQALITHPPPLGPTGTRPK